MNELRVVNFDGIEAIDSRDIAAMMGREHKELLKSIRQNIEYFNGGEVSPSISSSKAAILMQKARKDRTF